MHIDTANLPSNVDPFTLEQPDMMFMIPDEHHDLYRLPEDRREQLMQFLSAYSDLSTDFQTALDANGLKYQDVVFAVRRSQTYKAVWEAAKTARREIAVNQIEDAQIALATGRARVDKAHYAPSTQAASLFLSANDARYKSGNQTPASAVNIQLNI